MKKDVELYTWLLCEDFFHLCDKRSLVPLFRTGPETQEKTWIDAPRRTQLRPVFCIVGLGCLQPFFTNHQSEEIFKSLCIKRLKDI